MANPYAILGTILDAFGVEPGQPPMRYESGDESLAVGILHQPACPDDGIDSWATVQASDFATPYSTPDDRAIRVEFVTAVDAQLTRFGDVVAACAFQINPGTAVRPGTVYRGAVAHVYPDAATPHIMSVSPFFVGERV